MESGEPMVNELGYWYPMSFNCQMVTEGVEVWISDWDMKRVLTYLGQYEMEDGR